LQVIFLYSSCVVNTFFIGFFANSVLIYFKLLSFFSWLFYLSLHLYILNSKNKYPLPCWKVLENRLKMRNVRITLFIFTYYKDLSKLTKIVITDLFCYSGIGLGLKPFESSFLSKHDLFGKWLGFYNLLAGILWLHPSEIKLILKYSNLKMLENIFFLLKNKTIKHSGN